MTQTLGYVSVVVADYDEAISWYTRKLGFRLLEDKAEAGKRWVLVAPGGGGCALLLARAKNAVEASRIGDQTGGRVFLFLHTDDFWRDYERMRAAGVVFRQTPRRERYGTVAVFADLYGNLWDLLHLYGPARHNEDNGNDDNHEHTDDDDDHAGRGRDGR